MQKMRIEYLSERGRQQQEMQERMIEMNVIERRYYEEKRKAEWRAYPLDDEKEFIEDDEKEFLSEDEMKI